MTRIWLWAPVAACALALVPSASSRQTVTPSSISPADKASGAKAHPELLREFGGAYAGPQAAYVERVGRKIAVQSGLSNAQSDFTVTLLNSPVNNAFAIPGGYVYITRQLTALANDEAELAGVLGHEVGHVAARHSQQRQKAAQRNAIGGTLLQVLAGAVAGDSALGGLLQKGIGTGSQLLTLRFSRAQETEADDLGVRYLARAGYDPTAMSTMLDSLAGQTDLDQRIAGNARSVPAWASTHPDPGARVVHADEQAKASGAKGGVRNRDAFLAAIDGMLYGDDPKQGVIDGRRFLHPELRLSFSAPQGFGMENSTDAVSITGNGGQAQFGAAAYKGDLRAYVQSVFAGLNGGTAPDIDITRTSVDGIPAGYATLGASTKSSQVDITVFAYDFGGGKAYHFLLVTPRGQGIGPFGDMVTSVRRLSPSEAAAIKPRRVTIATVKAGDTPASLAERMAYGNYRLDRFLALNRMSSDQTLRAGQKVKLITY